MKKQLLCFILIYLWIAALGAGAAADIRLYVNDRPVECDVPPVIINDRTLVPARALFEPLGASLAWNDEQKQAVIDLHESVIKLTINSAVAYVNDTPFNLDAPPVIIQSRTMLPVRFVAENLGYAVDWNAGTRAVYIQSPEEEETPPPASPGTASNSILSVTTDKTAEELAVRVRLKEPLAGYQVYPMDNPPRTVLELQDSTYNNPVTVDIQYEGIQKLRMANHPSYFKLVADLDEALPYRVVLSEDKTTASLIFSLGGGVAPPAGNTVVIDAGHGGSDPGALGYRDGEVLLREKEVNLDIANRVCDILKQNGVRVLTTRSADVTLPLSGRYTFANNAGADLFVSIHCNSFADSSVNGSLTLYSEAKDKSYPEKKSSREIAKTIQSHLVQSLGSQDKGVRSEDLLAVLRHTTMPAVLVEVVFLTGNTDQDLILPSDSRQKAAEGIANGILAVLNDKPQ